MEYVGRRVNKELKGDGVVQAYDTATGVCKIVYDGGDSEELGLPEVSSLLLSAEPSPPPPPQQPPPPAAKKPGRKPKRRRCIVDKGTENDDSLIECRVSENLVIGGFEGDLNVGIDLNSDVHAGDTSKLNGLDLNECVNLELSEKLHLDEGVAVVSPGEKKEIIDLNMDVNEGSGKSSDGGEGRCFDLNLQLAEDEARNLEDCQMGIGENEGCVKVIEVLDVKENLLNVDGCEGNPVAIMENTECSPMKISAPGADSENVTPISTKMKTRGRKRKGASIDSIVDVSTPEPPTGNVKSEFESGVGSPLEKGNDSVDHDNGVPGTIARGRRVRRTKQLLPDNDTSLATPATGLRRSSRRVKKDDSFGQDYVFNTPALDEIDRRCSSRAIRNASTKKPMTKAREKSPVPVILPPKVELPPSTCNLELSGVSVFDFFSVYAFLRSFSTLLFLSPFEMDGFVASVKCKDSTLLFDCIHVSLLKILRKHLEFLSNEGSVSASDCLRSLNWDFLDLITWPMFAVEYLLLHSPGYIPGIDICQLKLHQNDYYEFPVSVKVEILRHLCDDVLDVEAFRSELNRRTLTTDPHADLVRETKFDSSRKRKATMGVATTSCVTEEDAAENVDGNIDECCLCKMDGNLICCDGCPAAFHSRCVGVVSSMLPEGDWYCPECVVEKSKPWMKVGKSIRGAELLGSDPHGRLFYSSCGYLLVSESCNDKDSFYCYNQNDFHVLIDALESSPFIYDTIINAICKHWNLVRGVSEAKNDDVDSRSCSLHPVPSAFSEKMTDEKSMGSTGITDSGNAELDNAEHANAILETGNNGLKIENCVVSSEGSTEAPQTFKKDVSLSGPDCSERCLEILNDFHIPGDPVDAGDLRMTSTTMHVEKGKILGSESHRHLPSTINSGELSPVHCETNYINNYELARTASTVYEELTCRISDKTSEVAPITAEEIIAVQVKVVSDRFTEFSWSNVRNLIGKPRKERCGWCYYCRYPIDGRDCLIIMNDTIPAVESFTCENLGTQPRKHMKNHLLDIRCHIICIEDHLQGLLFGPWLNPNYSMLWRKSVLGVDNISALKDLLLKLELNLHHLALSADWRKHVDSVITMGSASHIVSSARASSKHGVGRKRVKSSETGTVPSSNVATGLGLFWWRGGRGSRMLFNWKVLPHSLVSKAARQGGRKKIPDILYPDSGEYAKRTKRDSWRAAVETSASVAQLALQVRELDANVRWHDIWNNSLTSKVDISRKPLKSFKKVTIRKKCSEGSLVRYLLDFGKKRFIPDVVLRNGSKLEDSSNERKRYWLEESHIPLHLLKSFEEKRVARKSNKMGTKKLHESSRVTRKPFQRKGFEYLFSRAERAENHQCGHCKKDVLIREAVSCQDCKGFFHKRHVQKISESIQSACSYICHKCSGGQYVEAAKKGKPKPQYQKLKDVSKRVKSLCSRKGKKMGKAKRQVKSKHTKVAALVEPLRRSARNAERIGKRKQLSLQKTVVKKRKRSKRARSEKAPFKKPKISCWKKKRAPISSCYWFNGLQFTRSANDERLVHFRSRMLLVLHGEMSSIRDETKCSLCGELEHRSDLNYVACEICGVWLHVDALDLGAGEIENVIGFKCHTCLHKRTPLCPHSCPIGNSKDVLTLENNTNTDCTRENSNSLANTDDSSAYQKSHSNEESNKDRDFALPEKI